ncbi:MAG: ATP synthase F1 subunit gamma [Lachnospiraceae bacterium]|nr:ATP synthase F1 subunit gamma [Lachnospiraceae bacterium]
MASAEEILSRIKSVQNMMKITEAMYMISSSKLQRAKRLLSDNEPFFFGLQATIATVLSHVDMEKLRHIYFDNRIEDEMEKVKKKGIIVLTADKGLAGAYNKNVLKAVDEKLKEEGERHLFVVGEIGRHYYEKKKTYDSIQEFHLTAQDPTMHRARSLANAVLGRFLNDQLDEVTIIYTQMANAMSMVTVTDRVLPLSAVEFQGLAELEKAGAVGELTLVPSASKVIDSLVPNYITGYIYSSLVEAYASEHNARMMAMQTATNAAKDMLASLSVEYNRVRQTAITQEVTEVMGGAKALKQKKAAQMLHLRHDL